MTCGRMHTGCLHSQYFMNACSSSLLLCMLNLISNTANVLTTTTDLTLLLHPLLLIKSKLNYYMCIMSVYVCVRWPRATEVQVRRSRWLTCGPGVWEERRLSSCSTSSGCWSTPLNLPQRTCKLHHSTGSPAFPVVPMINESHKEEDVPPSIHPNIY